MTHLNNILPDRFRPGLAVLLTAFDYAQDSQTDPWQFAVELPELLSQGATLTDIRWLILHRFGEHAKETTVPGDEIRSFRPLAPTSFPTDACIVLSPAGAAAARGFLSTRVVSDTDAGHSSPSPIDDPDSLQTESAPEQHASSPPSQRGGAGGGPSSLVARPITQAPPAPPSIKPVWDPSHRELCYNGQVVKRYRVPAANQIAILDAFQEEGWPEFIDDPIPPDPAQDPKRRLSVTIKSLNHMQIAPILRFHGNGDGQRVHWEYIARNAQVVDHAQSST